jgi:tRNA(Ile)-lysidine synthase
MTDLDRAIHDALAQLPSPPRAILHAWSGGLDSTALLHALISACDALHIPLQAAHIDHQLRASSSLDAAFCAEHAARLHIPLTILPVRVPATGSTQAQARAQRHAALADHARAIGADVITMAHHQDDAIESALLHMQRGQGALGLSSLTRCARPMPAHPDLWLVRPLLDTPRAAIEAWAAARALRWHEDPTNAGDDYTRNQLRHHAIPALMAAPGAAEGIARSLATLAQEADALEQLTHDLLQRARLVDWPEPASVALHLPTLRSAHPALLARSWQQLMTQLGVSPLSADLIDALSAWCLDAGDSSYKKLQLAQAVAEREGELLTLGAAPGQGWSTLEAARAQVSAAIQGARGEIAWFGGTLRWSGDEGRALELRGLRAGDRWGQDGRKVAEALRAMGVGQRVRWRWPLVAERGASVVWWAAGQRRRCPGIELVWEPPEGSAQK